MIVDTRVRKFDPNFPLPKELQFAEYDQESPVTLVDDNSEVAAEDDSVVFNETDEDSNIVGEDEDSLDVPTILSIVSQTVRTAPDGRTVVDVVLSAEDVYGATQYDVRVTKV